jgi:hypothetical protein
MASNSIKYETSWQWIQWFSSSNRWTDRHDHLCMHSFLEHCYFIKTHHSSKLWSLYSLQAQNVHVGWHKMYMLVGLNIFMYKPSFQGMEEQWLQAKNVTTNITRDTENSKPICTSRHNTFGSKLCTLCSTKIKHPEVSYVPPQKWHDVQLPS